MKKNYLEEAINEGIGSIISEHPRFSGMEAYLLKHIDKKKLRESLSSLKGEKLDEYQVYQEIADYVSSGEAFDDKGKKIILKSSLEGKAEGKGLLRKLFRKPKFDGEKYLDETMEAFGDLYALFQSGEYAQRMPELTESVGTLYDLRFLNPAIDVLRQNGMIDDKKYGFLKKEVYAKAKDAQKRVVGGVENYLTPEKVAASIFAGIGIFMALASTRVTGAVVGVENSNPAFGLLGLGLIAVSAVIFVFSSRKRVKITNKKMVKKHKR
jgi:hypothetical protein